jgi:hypothetical protein
LVLCILLLTVVRHGFHTIVCPGSLCYPACNCDGLTGFILSLGTLVPNGTSEVRLSLSFAALYTGTKCILVLEPLCLSDTGAFLCLCYLCVCLVLVTMPCGLLLNFFDVG